MTNTTNFRQVLEAFIADISKDSNRKITYENRDVENCTVSVHNILNGIDFEYTISGIMFYRTQRLDFDVTLYSDNLYDEYATVSTFDEDGNWIGDAQIAKAAREIAVAAVLGTRHVLDRRQNILNDAQRLRDGIANLR